MELEEIERLAEVGIAVSPEGGIIPKASQTKRNKASNKQAAREEKHLVFAETRDERESECRSGQTYTNISSNCRCWALQNCYTRRRAAGYRGHGVGRRRCGVICQGHKAQGG